MIVEDSLFLLILLISFSSPISSSSVKLLYLQFSFDVRFDVALDKEFVEAPKSDVVVGLVELKLKKFMLFMMGGEAIVAADEKVEADKAA